MFKPKNFVLLESAYGPFLLNRYCHFQSETLLKTGYTHIEHELGNIFVVIDKLPKGCVILDGGANAGFFAIPVAARVKSKNGIVICFEPQREIFNGLAGTVALNDLDNVRINRMGLSNITGSAYLPTIDYSKSQDFGLVSICQSSSHYNHYDEIFEQNTVRTIKIDDIKLNRLDFLKLDVEGFEISAIQGAEHSIKSFRPFIWVEYWKVGIDELKDSLKFVNEYECIVMDSLNVLFAPIEKLNSYQIEILKK